MTVTALPTAILSGDCEDAREHFGISTECGSQIDHHPSRLVEVDCCDFHALVCQDVASDAEFVQNHQTKETAQ